MMRQNYSSAKPLAYKRNIAPTCVGCPTQGGTGTEGELLRQIQEIDFSIYETVLYLDAYPNSKAALEYYHSLVEKRTALVNDYELEYRPISFLGNKSTGSWDWISSPWPWQG